MPMKRTKNDESASNPNQTMKQYSLRLSTQLYEEASALYREFGILISTALSAFFAGTVSAGTLPFSLSQDCARFLKTRAHDALFRAVQAELNAEGGPEQCSFPFHAAKAPRLETFSLGIPDKIRTGCLLYTSDRGNACRTHEGQRAEAAAQGAGGRAKEPDRQGAVLG